MDNKQTPRVGYNGTIDQIRLIDLVQLSCLAKMSHRINVASPAGSGNILVDNGAVTHAELGDLKGEGAFCEVFTWAAGHFQTASLPEDRISTISRTWEYLLIEAMRYASDRAGGGKGGAADASQAVSQGFTGNIEAIPLTDLVQLACMAGKDRVIHLESGSKDGRIYVKGGQVCHVETGGVTGEDAFCEMLNAQGGGFETTPLAGEVETTIVKPWEYLLIDAMRFLDEQDGAPDEEEDATKEGLLQRLQRMKVSEKIRMAMMGDKEARVLLIRDSNRMVQLAIINNPRITEGEVASIAYSRNVDEEVLRRIAQNREWTKLYQVRAALVKNPKTPLTISMKMVQTLPANDLKELSRSKSVPATLATAARRHTLQKS